MLNPFETYNKIITKPKEIQKEMVVTLYISSSPAYVRLPVYYITYNNNSFRANQNFRIEWGDGQSTEVYDGQLIKYQNTILNHRYSSTGYKEVKIISETGTLDSWRSSQSGKYDSSNSSDGFSYFITRYDTPILKITDTSPASLGFDANYSNLSYVDDYLLKNNSHRTVLYLEMKESIGNSSNYSNKGCSFTLNRNILLDMPNLVEIRYYEHLISKYQTNYNVEDIFAGCPNLQNAYIYSNYYLYLEGNRFPSIFKPLKELRIAGSEQRNNATVTKFTVQLESVADDLFRYNPKLNNIRQLFQNQVNLNTSNISFTKGGFFAENWEPETQVDLVGLMHMKEQVNTVDTGNAQELYETLETLPNGYDATSAIYNHTNMIGYSSVPSNWKNSSY